MTNPIETTPICDACGTPMKLVPAGVSKKTGKAYGAFWSCPNNRECGGKTMPYTSPKQKVQTSLASPFSAEILYKLKEIVALLESIDMKIGFDAPKVVISKKGIAKDFPGKKLQPDDDIPVVEETEEETGFWDEENNTIL